MMLVSEAPVQQSPESAAVEPQRSTALLLLQVFVWLLSIFPARLVFGPIGAFGSPASLVGLCAFIFWAAGALRPGTLVRTVMPVRIAVVAFWLMTLPAYAVLHLNSVPTDEANGADRWILFTLVWSGVALLGAEGLRDVREVMRLMRVVVAGAAFCAFVAVLQSRLGIDLTVRMAKLPGLSVAGELQSVLSRSGLSRPAGTATHPIEFGCLLAMTLGPAIVLATHDRGWVAKRRWIALALISLGIPMAISRSAILGALIVGAFWFTAAAPRQRIQAAIWVTLLSVAVFLTTPGLIGTLKSYFVNASTDSSITTRTDDYAAVAHFIRHSPVIGRGPWTFLPKYRILDNTWLTTIIEMGVVGVVCMALYLFSVGTMGRGIRRRSNDPMLRALGQSLAGISVVVVFVGTTYDFYAYPMGPGFFAAILGMTGAVWSITRYGDQPTVTFADPALGEPVPVRATGMRVDEQADLGTKAKSAMRWSLIAQFLARAGSFSLGLILARLLTPQEFGTYTVALGTFLILLTVDDLGIIKGLVRWPGSFEEAMPTARLLGTISGLAVYLVVFLLAPVIATTTSSPDATAIIRVLCIGLLVDSSIQIVPAASLQRRFRQDLWVLVELFRLVVMAGVTIGLAAAGAGVWSLAWGALAGQLAMTITTNVLARVRWRYGYDPHVARALIRVSAPYAGAALVGAALLNVDYLVIGRHLGPVAVGVYLIAFNVSSWPITLVSAAVRSVSIPGFSQLKQSGGDVGKALSRSLIMLVGGALPFIAVVIAVPALAIRTLYGPDWVGGASSLRFLALLAVVRVIDGLVDDVLFASAKSPWILQKNIVWVVALVIGLSIGANHGGIRGVGIAHAIIGVGLILPLVGSYLVRLGLFSRALLSSLAVLAVAAVVAGVAGWWVGKQRLDVPNLVHLALAGTVVVIVYAGLLFPFRRRLTGTGSAPVAE